MASEERKMAFAEHARKGGAGSRVLPRSTETYRPRRKNIRNSIFRQNVFAKNNVLQITYISPRLPQRFVFLFFLCFSTARVPILEFKFQTNSFLGIQIPLSEYESRVRNPCDSECHKMPFFGMSDDPGRNTFDFIVAEVACAVQGCTRTSFQPSIHTYIRGFE